MFNNDRQTYWSGTLSNDKSYQTSGPIQRTRREPSWLWLKLLILLVVGSAAYRFYPILANLFS